MTKLSKDTKLEQNRLWKLASDIMLYAYDQVSNLSEDERFGMQAQLRSRAFELTASIAEAVGSVEPRDKTYHFGRALRNVYGVRNVVLMAGKTGQLQIDNGVLVKLDKIAEGLRKEVSGTANDIPDYLRQFTATDTGKPNGDIR